MMRRLSPILAARPALLLGTCLAMLFTAGTRAQTQTSAPASAERTEMLRQAGQAIAHDAPDEAIRALSVWLEHHPRDFDALVMLGSLYNQERRPDRAEPLLARAVRIQPASAAARIEWAGALARLHHYRRARAALAHLSPPAPPAKRIAYLRLKASIDFGIGNARQAARHMEEAFALAPQDARLALATAVAEEEAGDWTQAMEHLRPLFASTRGPDAGTALLRAEVAAPADHSATLKELDSLALPSAGQASLPARWGAILAAGGFNAEAADEFKKAVEASPGAADLNYDLALARFNAGQLDAALAVARDAQRLADSAALEGLMGDLQEARGQSLDAVHSYQAAVSLAPREEQFRLSLGLELLRHHTFEAALAVFKQTAELFPQSRRARTAEGLTYYCLEQYPQAIKTLVQAARVRPGDLKGEKPEGALDYLGEIQLQPPVTPDPSAIAEICHYAAAHPDGAEAAYCGALELRVEHDRGDAAPSASTVERLRQAARRAPGNVTARCGLAQALEWMRQWQPAEAEMEACLRLDPDSVEGHYRMASIARHLGQTERAARELQLHDAAQERLVQSNAARDRTLQKFLYTMTGAQPKPTAEPQH